MRTLASLAALLLLLSLAAAAAPATPPSATLHRLVLPESVTPIHYDVRIVPDASQLSFAGSVTIDINVHRPVRQIVLNAASLVFIKVKLSGTDAAPEVTFDTDQQTATLRFGAPVAAGDHVLAIDYTGTINRHAAGLFALDYDTAQGKKRALYTQFENSDARRFIPCWDEPARKATFTLGATVPAGETALSNMPVASTETLPGGLKHVQFATSPKMSSYLLFFGTGDLERVSRTVNGVDVGVVVKRGDGGKAAFALDAAASLLPYYEDYFGAKYPLPKLDLVAAPGQSQFFGAMENWGAIFFFERAVLIDPKISTEGNLRSVYLTVAHEMAHQWFGDLVTMQWWDDIWLNEGFASWMERKAADHFHPEWKVGLGALVSKERAMAIDARRGTHPVVQPIRDVLQANQAFDTITYQKGEAVIRMLEAAVGEAAFRDGVRRYMKAEAYGNAVSDDFWKALDQATSVDVSGIARDFTLQPGVPLIRGSAGTNGIRLTQDRFAADESGRKPTRWRVPVLARPVNTQNVWHGIVARDMPARMAGNASEGILVNSGQAGYFRTLYSAEQLHLLVSRFRHLPDEDQLGLLHDSLALGNSGYQPLSAFLELASQAAPELDPFVLDTIAEALRAIDDLYIRLPTQDRFRAFGRKVLQPLFAKTGWSTLARESQNTTILRATLLAALSQFDDAAIIAEARARFSGYLKDPSLMSTDLRHSVLAIVAEHADDATWEQLHTLARTSATALEKQEVYALLGTARDPDLADRTLQLSLQDEVPFTLRATLIEEVSRRYFPERAFAFAVAHLDQVYALLEPDSRFEFVPDLAWNSKDAGMIPKLHAFAEAHIPAGARKDARMAEATMSYNSKIRAERLPEIDRWLAEAAR